MSRLIGRGFVGNKDYCINQTQHIQPNGEYEIKDKEKRAEFEKEKAKQNATTQQK